MSTLVYINKLQARVRYTHITCRYLWINHPELLILRDALTDPNAGKPLPSWAKTLRTSPSSLAALHQPTISLQIPQGTRRPKRAKNQVSSCVTLLIPPPPTLPLPPKRVDLMYREGTCTNIAHLTYVCNLLHTPLHTSIRYTHRNPGMEYTTTNLLHSCNINMKNHWLYL